MAKKPTQPVISPFTAVSAERATRLFRLLKILEKSPQNRTLLVRKLGVGVRGFYRDLELLRAIGIVINMVKRRYTLMGNVQTAIDSLPFPDPGLTLGEACQLAKGKTVAHRKLKSLVAQVMG